MASCQYTQAVYLLFFAHTMRSESFCLSTSQSPQLQHPSTSLWNLGGRKRLMAQGKPLRESWVPGSHGHIMSLGALRGCDERCLGVNDRGLHGDTLARADEHVRAAIRGNKHDAGHLVRYDLDSNHTARSTRSQSSDDDRSVYTLRGTQ